MSEGAGVKRQNNAGWVAGLVLLGIVVAFWQWIVGAAFVAALVWAMYRFGIPWMQRQQELAADRRNGETARKAALAARAQIQHEQYLAGDDRGIYGQYRPEPLE